jgi:hypothetical protein
MSAVCFKAKGNHFRKGLSFGNEHSKSLRFRKQSAGKKARDVAPAGRINRE